MIEERQPPGTTLSLPGDGRGSESCSYDAFETEGACSDGEVRIYANGGAKVCGGDDVSDGHGGAGCATATGGAGGASGRRAASR